MIRPPRQIGYCTNVHAGTTLETMRENIERYAVEVKRQVSPSDPMGIGLWLSASVVRQVREQKKEEELADWLDKRGLVPFTFNGFPYGNFHQEIVKHDVYFPTWFEKDRLDYTLELVEVLDRLLPEGREGSISTLPISWGIPPPTADQMILAKNHLHTLAERLRRIEEEKGRLIYLCIEPEPGCLLQTTEDVVRFFNEFIPAEGPDDWMRRYLRVCHDVCHSAVMFEDQQTVFNRYREEGILVGKVQVSAAVSVPLAKMNRSDRQAAIHQLRSFAEDRYLHQTVVKSEATGETTFYVDLPEAFSHAEPSSDLKETWRVHFHVPIYLERFGLLRTTRSAIDDMLAEADLCEGLSHFEVETYAWNVLPAELQQPNLATGIASELQWFQQQLSPTTA